MTIILRRYRDWWQPPRRAGDHLEDRWVTFLELLYDLVYVVIIAELSHALAEHITWGSLGGFAFLFVIVWWAWFNGTSCHDLHGQNDIRTRVLTFLQMISVVAMAVFAHDALGERSVGFALSYAAFQLILTYMWWRTGCTTRTIDHYRVPIRRRSCSPPCFSSSQYLSRPPFVFTSGVLLS